MSEEQDREKITRYQVLQQRVRVLDNRRKMIAGRLEEVDNTLSSLEDLKGHRDKDIFLPLGSGVFVEGSLKDSDKMIVLIGSDTAVDVNYEKAKEVIEDNKRVLNDGLKTLENEMSKAANELMSLEPEIQKILQKSR